MPAKIISNKGSAPYISVGQKLEIVPVPGVSDEQDVPYAPEPELKFA